MRAWARKNGYDVAERGRLPAEVTEAYRDAHGKKAAATKTATKAAPARKAPAKKAPAKRPVVEAPTRRQETVEVQPRPAEPAAAQTPRPKPSLVSDDRRLVALGEEIKSLTARVEALEKASGGGKPGSSKANPFRRRS